jgi:hypothetical protein
MSEQFSWRLEEIARSNDFVLLDTNSLGTKYSGNLIKSIVHMDGKLSTKSYSPIINEIEYLVAAAEYLREHDNIIILPAVAEEYGKYSWKLNKISHSHKSNFEKRKYNIGKVHTRINHRKNFHSSCTRRRRSIAYEKIRPDDEEHLKKCVRALAVYANKANDLLNILESKQTAAAENEAFVEAVKNIVYDAQIKNPGERDTDERLVVFAYEKAYNGSRVAIVSDDDHVEKILKHLFSETRIFRLQPGGDTYLFGREHMLEIGLIFDTASLPRKDENELPYKELIFQFQNKN